MNKEEFLKKIRKHLRFLDRGIVEEAIEYYDEIIDDLMEDGYTEEEIQKRIGSPLEIANRILEENQQFQRNEDRKEKEEKKPMTWFEMAVKGIILLLCSPFLVAIMSLIIAGILVVGTIPFTLFVIAISFVLSGVVMLIQIPIHFELGISFIIARLGLFLMLSSGGMLLFLYSYDAMKYVIRKVKIMWINMIHKVR